MHNPNLSFAKIVATPTDTAWSQVYNAGSLFLVISLSTDNPTDELPLNSLGKQVINNLEAEFFTLEKKDLPSIKSAVTTSLHEVPDTITVSLALAYGKETILYLLLVGPGKIIMKRQDAIGVLLESKTDQRESITASGYVTNDDTVLLQTTQFAQLVTQSTLHQAFDLTLPSDIAETLTPSVHASGNGAASAIVVHFKGMGPIPVLKSSHPHISDQHENYREPEKEESRKESDANTDENTYAKPKQTPAFLPKFRMRLPLLPGFKKPRLINSRWSRTKIRMFAFIGLAVVIAIVLVASIFKTLEKQQQTKNELAFKKVYEAAEKNYDDGLSMQSLNPGFARDDFLEAQKKLETSIPKFPKGSPEEQKLSVLLQKVNEQLGSGGITDNVTPTEAGKTDSPTLTALADQSAPLFASHDGQNMYTITATDVLKDGKSIIKNDADWTAPAGFAVYLGNIYILDKKDGVLKYVVASDGYGKTSYFGDSKPDLSQAAGMAIDGSVWILFSDSRIMKFTKGQSESFTIKGLEKLFSRPAGIVTTVDGTTLYILDPGNSRIVTIGKDGTYKKSYASSGIAKAKAIDTNESASSLYFLSDKKIFKLPL